MLTLNRVSYIHANGDLLFDNINLAINAHDKIALIGNNGSGKSTLLKILAGQLLPAEGTRSADAPPYYIPQHFGQFNALTVAQALRIDEPLKALQEITSGHVTEANLAILHDDWLLEERCHEALAQWKMEELNLHRKMETLSGGQKTKVFLAGIMIHQPAVVLLDEPSNHLDIPARDILYHYIRTTTDTLVVVSHDRTLLNLLNTVYTLSKRGITVYGGNYDFYTEQKAIEANALQQDLKSKEKALRKAKEVERESLERKQKLDARGKKKQEKAGLPTISMNTFKNNAEKSTARMKDTHTEKIDAIAQELGDLRKELPAFDKIKLDLDNSQLHRGKKLIEVQNINFMYNDTLLWKEPLNFQIASGERIAIKGTNGSGKTTLIRVMLGEAKPITGTVERVAIRAVYIDQDYSLINHQLSIYEQAQQFNYDNFQEHEVKIRLNRFLFTKEYWNKPCSTLSGGEKMRLMLCCLMISHHAPDLIILDEPTNNLDMQNIAILTAAIQSYSGTLVVVSHDIYFLEQVRIEREIVLI
ncbi:MAG TPA: ABC-F family ATP-binding cassette domain-containing protein [Ohtaekwangia sp.]|uniref:ribosomal protection-like ABC-F family protein n=1 Tax=Ohtaekwangia sp. TaxID=2066019 RepID=UPI002F95EFF9